MALGVNKDFEGLIIKENGSFQVGNDMLNNPD